MKKTLLLLIFLIHYVMATPVSYEQIDKDKAAIQVAVVKYLKSLKPLSAYEKKYDTYLEKRNNYIYYIVNIDKEDKKRVLQDIRKRIKNAFLVNPESIKNFQQEAAKQTTKPIEEKKTPIINSASTLESMEYKKALYLYKQKEYAKAYEMFNELFFKDMGNILVNYYLGRSAYETKQYEFAISAYDRILIAEPDNTRVRLELAQTYLQMQLYSQSLKEFTATLEGKMPPKVREKVVANIEMIKAKQTKHFFNITTLLSVIYDSNVNNSPKAGDFDIYNPTLNSNVTLNNSGDEESTMVYQVAAIMNHKYRYSDQFLLDNSLTAMVLKYDDFKEKDIHYFSLVTKPTYFMKDAKFDVAFIFDKFYLGHEDYQNNFYITPSYTTVLSPETLFTTALKMGRINYVDDSTKSANTIALHNSLKYLTQEYGLFSFGLNVGKEIALKNDRTDVTHNFYNFSIGNSFDFSQHYSLISGVNYKISVYKDEDVNFLSPKKDKKQDYSLTLQRKLDETSVISVGGAYTKQNSNHESSPYSKHTFKINYLKSF